MESQTSFRGNLLLRSIFSAKSPHFIISESLQQGDPEICLVPAVVVWGKTLLEHIFRSDTEMSEICGLGAS